MKLLKTTRTSSSTTCWVNSRNLRIGAFSEVATLTLTLLPRQSMPPLSGSFASPSRSTPSLPLTSTPTYCLIWLLLWLGASGLVRP